MTQNYAIATAARLSHRLAPPPSLPCTCSVSIFTQKRARSPIQFPSKRHLSSAPLPPPLRHPYTSNTDTSIPSSSSSSYSPSLPSSSLTGYGQPLPSTHSHILSHGQLTEGIPYSEYESRRKKLMDGLPSRSIVVLPGNRLQYISQSIFHKFRQATDFFYLTGWLEPDAAVILEKDSSRRGYKMTLFCRSRDAEQELWEGPRNGPNGAVDVFGADQAMDIAHFTSHLKTLLTSGNTDGPIYVDLPDNPTASIRAPRGASKSAKSIFNFLSGNATSGGRRTALDLGMTTKKSDYDQVLALLGGNGGNGSRSTKSLKEEVEKLRIIKSPNEIVLMRKAADISADAHAKVMRLAEPGGNENTLVSTFEYHCAIAGSARPAYLPVCASGANTRFLHYTHNNAILEAGSLVLTDAGCEYAGYASDITRTFPVSGKFTQPQRDLYQAVLSTVKECTKVCTAKASLTLYDLHEKSKEALSDNLRQLGVDVRGNEALFNKIYPHFVGHPLGLDLHDCATFQRHSPLKSGNVITIEPGVFMPDDRSIPSHFRNIAVRLEDEILIGEEDPIVLSINAPREIVDVEACCQGLLER